MIKKILKQKSFKNSVIYIFTDVLNKAIPFLLLPIFTKYLSTSDYGMVTIFISFTSLLMVFIGLNTQSAIYVNYFKYTKEEMQIYVSSIFLLILGSTFFTLLIVILFLEELYLWLEIPSLWLFLAVFYIFTQTVSSLLTILWVLEEKAFVFGLYQILNTLVFFILALVLIIEFNLTWVGQLSAMLFSSGLFFLITIVILWKKEYLKLVWSKEDIIDALEFGVPLIPHKLGEWIKLSADKFLLVGLVGSSVTGLYAVGYQIVSITIIFSIAIQKAWQPYLFKQLSNISSFEDKKKLIKTTYILFLILFLLSGGIYLLTPYLIKHFLDVKFIGAIEFIGYFSLTNFFITINHTLISYIYFTKSTMLLAKVTMITAIMHVLLSYFFILKNGAIGAAQASSISFFITLIILWIISHRLYPMPWNIFTKEKIVKC